MVQINPQSSSKFKRKKTFLFKFQCCTIFLMTPNTIMYNEYIEGQKLIEKIII